MKKRKNAAPARKLSKAGGIMYQTHWTAEKIKQFRKNHHLTQKDMAEMLGCRQQTVSEWELNFYSASRAYTILIDHATENFLAGKRFDKEMADATA